MTKKKAEILDSFYYDGRKKEWKEEHIAHRPIETPSKELMEHWLKEWDKTDGYPEQEEALGKLFRTLIPNNDDLNDILIKVCTLNDFYSTNIFKVIDVAKVILEMKIDGRLNSGLAYPELVDELSQKVFDKTGRHIYSFASKYFSHHKPESYPIYDSYVGKMLKYYRDKEKFCSFDDDTLLSYPGFCDVIAEFRKYYELGKYTVKEIDKMLWQMGKYHFPKYKEKE